MKLLDYLKEKKMTQKGFGLRVGVSDAHINLIMKGKKTPSIHLIQRIIRETDGQVTIDDLAHPEAPSRLKNKTNKE